MSLSTGITWTVVCRVCCCYWVTVVTILISQWKKLPLRPVSSTLFTSLPRPTSVNLTGVCDCVYRTLKAKRLELLTPNAVVHDSQTGKGQITGAFLAPPFWGVAGLLKAFTRKKFVGHICSIQNMQFLTHIANTITKFSSKMPS